MKNAHAHLLQNVRATDTWAVACLEATAVAGVIMLSALVKIPLPWTPVPVTLQTFPVLAAAYVVGRERAMGGILLYLALGIAGAPLFAVPFGATMGYLLAFAFAPYLTTAFKSPSVGMVAATAVIYTLGTAWLCLWAGVGLWAGLAMGVLPFIPADAVKIGMAYLVARRATKK
jgi:biotin transport system substrate-specific component